MDDACEPTRPLPGSALPTPHSWRPRRLGGSFSFIGPSAAELLANRSIIFGRALAPPEPGDFAFDLRFGFGALLPFGERLVERELLRERAERFLAPALAEQEL